MDDAIARLQIDTRAQSEVRRLSGGNQQKVTIARWIAGGVHTLLCFDPTRGIDIRTKRQIYALLRELAAAGAAVLLYTSELEEIQLVCDRAVVIFGGTVVDEMPAPLADEPTLLRAAYALPPDAAMPEERLVRMAAAAPASTTSVAAGQGSVARIVRRNGWTIVLFLLFVVFLALARVLRSGFGPADVQSLAIGVLPHHLSPPRRRPWRSSRVASTCRSVP